VPESLQAVDLFFLRVLTPANALARHTDELDQHERRLSVGSATAPAVSGMMAAGDRERAAMKSNPNLCCGGAHLVESMPL